MIGYGLVLWLLYNASAPTGLIVLGWIGFVIKAMICGKEMLS